MKSLVTCAVFVLGALSLASIGCQTPDDETLAEDLVEDGPEVDEQIGISPLCSDLDITELKIVFCGYQTGPTDTSPIQVTCARECHLDRQMAMVSGNFECTTVSRTCDSWVCPSCD